MIKFILACLSLPVFAGGPADSVAVFHRPEKVVVLINERGANSRLQKLLKAFGPEMDLLWENPDKSIRFNCGRNETAATCSIRLLPSESVKIEAKKVSASAKYQGPNAPANIELTWESSRANRFNVKILNGEIELLGQKP